MKDPITKEFNALEKSSCTGFGMENADEKLWREAIDADIPWQEYQQQVLTASVIAADGGTARQTLAL